MAGLTPGEYGSDSEGFARELEQLQQLSEAKQELDERESALAERIGQTGTAFNENTAAIERNIAATRELTQLVTRQAEVLATERDVLLANAEAWTTRASAMGASSRGGAVSSVARAESLAPVAVQAAAADERLSREASVASGRSRQQRRFSQGSLFEEADLAPGSLLGVLPAGAGRAADTSSQRATTEALDAQASAAERAAEAQEALVQRQQRASEAAASLASEQIRVNAAYNDSVAAYNDSSAAIGRSSGINAEFLSSFARGETSVKEFGSAIGETVGKFGGFAVAGAAFFGALDAVKQVGEGAVQTQEGVQQVSRFIPGVQSGAGRQELEGTFRNISTQLNVPIAEVTSAMSVMARVFHDVADAGEAAKAVLLAGRLDQIPQSQAEQYFTGIAQSFNYGPGDGSKLVGTVNSLNALQNRLGARVNQTLPALARAAPAAVAGGLSQNELEGLVAVGVRSGIPGAQVGTALLRSIGTFAYRPSSEAVLRSYGFDPVRGEYGKLIQQVSDRVIAPKPGEALKGNDIAAISNALFGPLLGGRVGLPILEHANLLPIATQLAATPPSAQKELDIVLGSVGEQARKLGIDLENLGSELESAGILEPVEVALKGLSLFGEGLEKVISPVDRVAQALGELPGPLKLLLGVLAAGYAGRAVGNTRLGLGVRGLASRAPGLGFLDDPEARSVSQIAERYQNIVPGTQRELDQARSRTLAANSAVVDTAARAQSSEVAAQDGSPESAEAAEQATAAYQQAQERAAEAVSDEATIAARLVQQQSIIETLTSDQISTQEKLNFAYAKQLSSVSVQTERVETALAEQRGADLELARNAPAAGSYAPAAAAAAAGGDEAALLAFQGETPAQQSASIATAAEENQPGLLQAAAQSNDNELSESPVGEDAEAIASRSAIARDAVGGLASGARSGAGALYGGLRGADPFSLLIASQAAGYLAPGGVGQSISAVGTTLAGGAFAAQFGGKAAGGAVDAAAGALGVEDLGSAALLSDPLFGAGAFGLVAGALTRGPRGAVEGVLGGAATGAAIGSIVPGIGTAIGAGAGAVLGGGLHFLGNDLLGSGQSGGARAQARRSAELNLLTQGETGDVDPATLRAYAQKYGSAGAVATSGGARFLPPATNFGTGSNPATLNSFSTVFAAELDSAFAGQGTQQDQEAAQQQVEKGVSQSAELLKATGFGSATGRSATSALGTALSAALQARTLRTDPYDIGQIIDTSSQALTQGVNTRFTQQLSFGEGPGQDSSALKQDITGVKQTYAESVTNAIKNLQANYRATLGVLNEDEASGKASGVISAAKTAVEQAKSQLGLATSAGTEIRRQDIVQLQQDAEQALTQELQSIANTASVAAAATANPETQAQVAITAARQSIARINATPNLSPAERQQQLAAQRAALEGAQQQRVQAQGSQLQAGLQATASAVPDYHPVAQAQANLSAAARYYEFVKNALLPNGKPAYSPEDVSQALQQQNALTIALEDAKYQEAADVISGQQALQQAETPANAAAVGAQQTTAGERLLAIARNRPERLQAEGEIKGGRVSTSEAREANAQTRFQITEAGEGGDPVAQAYTQLAAARNAEATALGPDQLLAAQAQYAQATQTLHQALQQEIIVEGSLRASTTNRTLVQDTDNLAAERKALAQAISGGYGKQTVQTDQTAVNQGILQRQNDYFSQRVATIEFQQSTLQISSQQALQEYEKMEKLKDLSVSQRQQLEQAVYQLETNQDNTSLFDLTPNGANIKVPTVFDVRGRADRERRQLGIFADAHADNYRLDDARVRDEARRRGSRGHGDVHSDRAHAQIGGASVNVDGGALSTHDKAVEDAIKDMHTTLRNHGPRGDNHVIHVNVDSSGSVKVIGNAQERATRTRVRARLRSAGVRGS